MNADGRSRYELMIRSAREAGSIALSYYPDLKAADFTGQVQALTTELEKTRDERE